MTPVDEKNAMIARRLFLLLSFCAWNFAASTEPQSFHQPNAPSFESIEEQPTSGLQRGRYNGRRLDQTNPAPSQCDALDQARWDALSQGQTLFASQLFASTVPVGNSDDLPPIGEDTSEIVIRSDPFDPNRGKQDLNVTLGSKSVKLPNVRRVYKNGFDVGAAVENEEEAVREYAAENIDCYPIRGRTEDKLQYVGMTFRVEGQYLFLYVDKKQSKRGLKKEVKKAEKELVQEADSSRQRRRWRRKTLLRAPRGVAEKRRKLVIDPGQEPACGALEEFNMECVDRVTLESTEEMAQAENDWKAALTLGKQQLIRYDDERFEDIVKNVAVCAYSSPDSTASEIMDCVAAAVPEVSRKFLLRFSTVVTEVVGAHLTFGTTMKQIANSHANRLKKDCCKEGTRLLESNPNQESRLLATSRVANFRMFAQAKTAVSSKVMPSRKKHTVGHNHVPRNRASTLARRLQEDNFGSQCQFLPSDAGLEELETLPDDLYKTLAGVDENEPPEKAYTVQDFKKNVKKTQTVTNKKQGFSIEVTKVPDKNLDIQLKKLLRKEDQPDKVRNYVKDVKFDAVPVTAKDSEGREFVGLMFVREDRKNALIWPVDYQLYVRPPEEDESDQTRRQLLPNDGVQKRELVLRVLQKRRLQDTQCVTNDECVASANTDFDSKFAALSRTLNATLTEKNDAIAQAQERRFEQFAIEGSACAAELELVDWDPETLFRCLKEKAEPINEAFAAERSILENQKVIARIKFDSDVQQLEIERDEAVKNCCLAVPLVAEVDSVAPFQATAPSATPTTDPSVRPTFLPSSEPTRAPSITPLPTSAPVFEPTSVPTASPSLAPTDVPTVSPSSKPTSLPSSEPTRAPSITPIPTSAPVFEPTSVPTLSPSLAPTNVPSVSHSSEPTGKPSSPPSSQPTTSPSSKLTRAPSVTPPSSAPVLEPTSQPTEKSSHRLLTNDPSNSPTNAPSNSPTNAPSESPTNAPSKSPLSPTNQPTNQPTSSPIHRPSNPPTHRPTSPPSRAPTFSPTKVP